jgi:hypothetical protein
MPDGAMTPDGIRAVVARAVIAVDEIPIVVDAATNGTDLGVPDASAAG